jgi:hypothetical protein
LAAHVCTVFTVELKGVNKKCIQIVVEKPQGKTPHRIPKYRWKGNIKMDLI